MVQKHKVNNFSHKKGRHCESSSMREIFEFIGFPMTEAMAFGLDGTLGFGYYEKSKKMTDFTEPFFVGGKQDTINPNSLACRLLGINLRKQLFSTADKGWIEAKKLLDQDIPLIIQVDIGYMPYENFNEEVHFGGHAITLGGYDEEKGIAFVGDTEFEGFQEIAIDKLKIARSSEKGSSFMFPKNTQYIMTQRPDGKRPPFAAAIKLAIQKACNHMLSPSMIFHGVRGLEKFGKAIMNWQETLKGSIINPYSQKKHSLAPLMFELTYGYLEAWGTGGGCFRKLYAEFLEELLNHSELKEGPKRWSVEEFNILKNCIPTINESAKNWTLVANTLKNAVDEYQDDCLKHVNLGELSDLVLLILTQEKELFTQLSKLKN